jgi:hypothetical protein
MLHTTCVAPAPAVAVLGQVEPERVDATGRERARDRLEVRARAPLVQEVLEGADQAVGEVEARADVEGLQPRVRQARPAARSVQALVGDDDVVVERRLVPVDGLVAPRHGARR